MSLRCEMEKKVTVVIPNYNGLKFMEPCFKALEAQSDKNFELLVVDNGSTDGSVEWLKEKNIPSVFLGENTGFSGAVNVGIRQAKTPYVILLNNDTEPEPDYVKELVRAMDRSPKIFSASSKMIQRYHKELMDDAGDMYSILMRPISLIWKILMWDTGQRSMDMKTCTARRLLFITWAAEPAAQSTIPLRSVWQPGIIFI